MDLFHVLEQLYVTVLIPPEQSVFDMIADKLENESGDKIVFDQAFNYVTNTGNETLNKRPCVFVVERTKLNTNVFALNERLEVKDKSEAELMAVMRAYVTNQLERIICGVFSRLLGYDINTAEELELLVESRDPRIQEFKSKLAVAAGILGAYVSTKPDEAPACQIKFFVLVDENFDASN